MKEFTYHRHFVSDDRRSLVLEFTAKVDGVDIQGVDIIKLNEQGQAEDFKVMVRPPAGIKRLKVSHRAAQLCVAGVAACDALAVCRMCAVLTGTTR